MEDVSKSFKFNNQQVDELEANWKERERVAELKDKKIKNQVKQTEAATGEATTL